MTTSKKLIRKIHIHRFRSFGDIDIEADLLNIYSGKNNSGKSNILKALNLFFNGMTSYDAPYSHEADYNISYRGAAGGKWEIRIELFFEPTGNGALKYGFSIVKHFIEGRTDPIIEYKSDNKDIQDEIDKNNGTITRQFTAFLNKIEYIYVPAVRDKKFVNTLLLNFEQIINREARSDEFSSSIGNLSKILAESSGKIGDSLKDYIGINARASLSSNATDVLGATKIQVYPGIQLRKKKSKKGTGKVMDMPVDLFSSGDGIVMSYLVYFLSYLTSKNNKNYIWGYEEPENSLEYSKVQKLAAEFNECFTKDAQIFITTHSPAFINLKDKQNVKFYRVYQRPLSEAEISSGALNRGTTYVQTLEGIDNQLSLLDKNDNAYSALCNELNLAEQAVEIENKLIELEQEKKEASRYAELYKSELERQKRPLVFSEGNNIKHIEMAVAAIEPDLINKIKLVDNVQDESGVGQLTNLYKGLCLYKPKQKVIIIFDCDAVKLSKTIKTKGNIIVYIIPKNESNKKIGGGIENLYPDNIIGDNLFVEKEALTNTGHSIVKQVNKAQFLNRIAECSKNDKSVFDCFKPIINEIKKHI